MALCAADASPDWCAAGRPEAAPNVNSATTTRAAMTAVPTSVRRPLQGRREFSGVLILALPPLRFAGPEHAPSPAFSLYTGSQDPGRLRRALRGASRTRPSARTRSDYVNGSGAKGGGGVRGGRPRTPLEGGASR